MNMKIGMNTDTVIVMDTRHEHRQWYQH
jgi:hypothetical protein